MERSIRLPDSYFSLYPCAIHLRLSEPEKLDESLESLDNAIEKIFGVDD